jgi:hypothetical protein
VPELERLGRTISAWEDQLLAYFRTGGVSNGPTEAVNLLVKRIKRAGFGFRNFANYRLRLLLHCGVSWHTHRPTRIRFEAGHHVLWRRAAKVTKTYGRPTTPQRRAELHSGVTAEDKAIMTEPPPDSTRRPSSAPSKP